MGTENGVLCSETLFASDNVVAAGDVARWKKPSNGQLQRIEHWTNAAESGAAAARNLLAGSSNAQPYDPVPFFWSDQYQTKIQMIGLPGPDDEVLVVEGSVEEGKLVALYRRDDRLQAVLAFSRPAKLMAYRPLLAANASFDEALAVPDPDPGFRTGSSVRAFRRRRGSRCAADAGGAAGSHG